MKFDLPKNHTTWDNDKTNNQIKSVEEDVANFNRQLNKLDGQINILKEKKRIIRLKISHKNIYKRQLEKQLKP